MIEYASKYALKNSKMSNKKTSNGIFIALKINFEITIQV